MSLSTATAAFLAPGRSLPTCSFLSLPKNSLSIRFSREPSPPALRGLGGGLLGVRALPPLLGVRALPPESAAADSDSGLGGRGLLLAAVVCGFVLGGACRRALALDGAGVLGGAGACLSGVRPKVLQLLCVFKDQGLVLAALLGLSAFFSMAETSITTLWPWKV